MAASRKRQNRPTAGIAAQVEALVRPVIQEMGVRLWDVRYEQEGPEWYLRVLIDQDEAGKPMDTDTCEAVSRAIDPLLDLHDPIPDSYYLEVGSPGLGRKLTRESHYDSLMGQKLRVRLYKPDDLGRKEIAGTLQSHDKDGFVLQEEQTGQPVRIEKKEAGSVKLSDDEGLF